MIQKKRIVILLSSFLLFLMFEAVPVPAQFAPTCIDMDADGYGSPGDASCPNGAQADCDETDAAVYPGAAKICDGSRDFSTDVDNDGDVANGFILLPSVGYGIRNILCAH